MKISSLLRPNPIYKKAAVEIIQNCKPFLGEIDNDIKRYKLYRGVEHKPSAPAVIRSARLTTREPRDTTNNIHDVFNEIFVERFGAPFRNAIFVTGSRMAALEYGELVTIYPIGEFKYLWSPEFRDLTRALEIYHDPDFDLIDQVRNIINKGNYKTTDLKQAIKSGNEIMLWCEKYYVVSSKRVLTQINQILKQNG